MNKEIEKIVDKIDKIHTDLSKLPISMQEYQPLSFELLKIKQAVRDLEAELKK